jgi:hypothetical protein
MINTVETPETDSFFFRTDIEWDDEVEFAQKLERERNQWRECAEMLAGWIRSRASFDLVALEALNEFERLKEGGK